MKKEELRMFINEQLYNVNELLGNHTLNVKRIPNPLYMIKPHQSEMKWDNEDNEVYKVLDELYEKLKYLKNKIK